jgi:hypothetical protein
MVYIPPIAKCAMDGAPGLFWLYEEEQRAAADSVRDETWKATAWATARWLVDGLPPTHRKVLDGWGTRFVLAVRRGTTGSSGFRSGMRPGKATARATARWLVDGLHPTHRKVRDGWGTRSVVAGEGGPVLWYELGSAGSGEGGPVLWYELGSAGSGEGGLVLWNELVRG